MREFALEPELRAMNHPDWFIWLAMILFIAYVLVRLAYRRYWRRFRFALIYPLEAGNLLKEQNINLRQSAILLNIISAISISCYLFVAIPILSTDHNIQDWSHFPRAIMAITCGFLIFKYAIIAVLGNIFGENETAKQINHSWLLHLKNTGLLLLIISLLAKYTNTPGPMLSSIFGLIFLLIVFIMNNLRAVQIMRGAHISLFYGILYLCSLEILPIAMIVSVVL